MISTDHHCGIAEETAVVGAEFLLVRIGCLDIGINESEDV